ncbi:D-aminoacyl-tRNA deacylase [Psilocybe cubensis]|uniref:D-aminoacyl-tRNA deacylase n=2 Tax=Psilocybe cubensis TaxID=181762 RepID=A0ACB8H9A5_PSICU|nr:D-aminoacyl-tRNA deacylase [Psilocybe cubensis]KAH9484441.1 D-aminoacyl-tRNA deacylase [Psilocybe cubensis]
MRAIIQCVSEASVTVNNELVSKISKGLMILVGIGTDDTDTDVATLSKKILTLRVFSDPSNPQNMWKASVKDIDGDILCVSQFTLMANTSKGNKPDFHRAMATEPSRAMYAKFLESLRTSYKAEKIQDGVFGAMMSVSLTNEGPVTITLDSRKFEYVETADSSKKGEKKLKAASETKTVETPIQVPTSAS